MSKSSHNRILIEIVIGIIVGILLGGFLPGFAVKLSILGDIFLNALMMIVVPVVMFSIITGITGIGNFKSLGSLGKNTMIYYVATTAISVTIGLILVNIIQPGIDVSTGETHQNYSYSILENEKHVVQLNNTLQKNEYDNKYKIELVDQDISGIIEKIIDDKIIVSYWIPENTEDVIFLDGNTNTKHPFKIIDKKLVSAEPEVMLTGRGIDISLSYKSKITQGNNNVFSTLKTVVVGDKSIGKEGLVPPHGYFATDYFFVIIR